MPVGLEVVEFSRGTYTTKEVSTSSIVNKSHSNNQFYSVSRAPKRLRTSAATHSSSSIKHYFVYSFCNNLAIVCSWILLVPS